MTQKPPYLLIFFIAAVLFSACSKGSESIQRDIIINPETEFTIPPIRNLNADTIFGDIPVLLNMDAEIKNNTSGQFNTANIRNIKITAFRIDLMVDLSDTLTIDSNNFGNLQNLTVEINGNNKQVTLAAIAGNPATMSGVLNLTANTEASAEDLKTILTAAALKYQIRTKLNRAINVPLKAKATATYRISMSL